LLIKLCAEKNNKLYFISFLGVSTVATLFHAGFPRIGSKIFI